LFNLGTGSKVKGWVYYCRFFCKSASYYHRFFASCQVCL